MGQIIIDKPGVGHIVSNKPSNGAINKEFTNRLVTRSVSALSPMGLLLALTYTTSGTFTTEYNP